MAKKIEKRKCAECGEQIRLDKDEFVPEKGSGSYRYFHKQCFINKKTNAKRNRLTEDECYSYIEECLKEYKNEKNKVKKDKYSANIRRDLTDYILEHYSITFLQKSFYVYLDSILSGSSSKVSRPVNPEDLLDMWIRKSDFLDKTHEKNRQRGKIITGEQLIKYDLAILLGKYDSYLEWKEKNAMAIADNEERKVLNTESVNYDVISAKPQLKNDGIDIASMLDEI